MTSLNLPALSANLSGLMSGTYKDVNQPASSGSSSDSVMGGGYQGLSGGSYMPGNSGSPGLGSLYGSIQGVGGASAGSSTGLISMIDPQYVDMLRSLGLDTQSLGNTLSQDAAFGALPPGYQAALQTEINAGLAQNAATMGALGLGQSTMAGQGAEAVYGQAAANEANMRNSLLSAGEQALALSGQDVTAAGNMNLADVNQAFQIEDAAAKNALTAEQIQAGLTESMAGVGAQLNGQQLAAQNAARAADQGVAGPKLGSTTQGSYPPGMKVDNTPGHTGTGNQNLGSPSIPSNASQGSYYGPSNYNNASGPGMEVINTGYGDSSGGSSGGYGDYGYGAMQGFNDYNSGVQGNDWTGGSMGSYGGSGSGSSSTGDWTGGWGTSVGDSSFLGGSSDFSGSDFSGGSSDG